jgi:hypothetical protein
MDGRVGLARLGEKQAPRWCTAGWWAWQQERSSPVSSGYAGRAAADSPATIPNGVGGSGSMFR